MVPLSETRWRARNQRGNELQKAGSSHTRLPSKGEMALVKDAGKKCACDTRHNTDSITKHESHSNKSSCTCRCASTWGWRYYTASLASGKPHFTTAPHPSASTPSKGFSSSPNCPNASLLVGAPESKKGTSAREVTRVPCRGYCPP
jgi:hypothetical protein